MNRDTISPGYRRGNKGCEFDSPEVGKGEARAVVGKLGGPLALYQPDLIERMPTLYLGACGLATAHD